jgi:hypothetical protein
MIFDPQSCWDCPVSIWITVALLALAIGIIGAGIAAVKTCRMAGRVIGAFAIAAGGLWYLSMAIHIPRWGVDWNPGSKPWHPEVLPERERILFWSAHFVFLAVAALALRRRPR